MGATRWCLELCLQNRVATRLTKLLFVPVSSVQTTVLRSHRYPRHLLHRFLPCPSCCSHRGRYPFSLPLYLSYTSSFTAVLSIPLPYILRPMNDV